jgi:hypothetical protein
MAPKVSKKTETKAEAPIDAPAESSLEVIKQEWFTIVKEITSTTEKLSGLEKKRDELVSKLWDIMNKNPTEHIVETEPTEEKKTSVKGVKASSKTKAAAKSEIIDDSENADSVKPKAKSAAKSSSKTATKPATKPVEPESESEAEAEEEKPKATKTTTKATTKAKPEAKSAGKQEAKPEAKPEVKPEVKKAPATKKISAPVKGTPKPKIDEDSDDEKARPVISGANDSSSESDVDSLSSVSSESEASGNDD